MKNLLFLLLLISCTREVKKPEKPHEARNWGAVYVRPHGNLIVSSELNQRRPAFKDTDKDGIYDNVDKCIRLKETYNGYLDGDGCPDSIPTPPDTTTTPPEDTTVIPPPPVFPPSYFMASVFPGNQGSEGSCVPFGAVYGQLSQEVYYKTGASVYYTYSTNVYSPEFVYNNVNTGVAGCSGGTSWNAVYNYLISTGAPLFEAVPYSWLNGCDPVTTTAPLTKIKAYQTVLSNDLTAIKTLLTQNHSLGFLFAADYNWYYGRDYQAGNYTPETNNNYVWKGPYSPEVFGGHYCLIIGYDDSKGAFKTLNSYGTGWGDAGFRWISYEWMAYISSRLFKIDL